MHSPAHDLVCIQGPPALGSSSLTPLEGVELDVASVAAAAAAPVGLELALLPDASSCQLVDGCLSGQPTTLLLLFLHQPAGQQLPCPPSCCGGVPRPAHELQQQAQEALHQQAAPQQASASAAVVVAASFPLLLVLLVLLLLQLLLLLQA